MSFFLFLEGGSSAVAISEQCKSGETEIIQNNPNNLAEHNTEKNGGTKQICLHWRVPHRLAWIPNLIK